MRPFSRSFSGAYNPVKTKSLALYKRSVSYFARFARKSHFRINRWTIIRCSEIRAARERDREGEEERKRGRMRRKERWMHSPACIHLIFGLLYLLIVMEVFQLRTNLIFHVEPDGVLWIFYPRGTLPSFAHARLLRGSRSLRDTSIPSPQASISSELTLGSCRAPWILSIIIYFIVTPPPLIKPCPYLIRSAVLGTPSATGAVSRGGARR